MLDLPSLQEIIDLLRVYYHDYGYAFVLIGAWLENIVLISVIWPGGVIVLLGAVYARLGELSLGIVILLSWIGSLLGTLVNYGLGRYAAPLSRRWATGLADFLARRPTPVRHVIAWIAPAAAGSEVDYARARIERALGRAADQINRHGASILLASQVSGHARCLAAVAAGATGYPMSRFLVIEAAGTLASSLLIGAIGYLIGENLELISQILSRINLGIALVIFALWLIRRQIVRLGGQFLRWGRAPAG